MKVSRHERAIRNGIVLLDQELDSKRKHSSEVNHEISCLMEQRNLLSRILNTADLMSSKSKEVSE